jgi:ABC-2 type transport system ATP-binding protein
VSYNTSEVRALAAIVAEGLRKEFRTKQKSPGFSAALRTLMHPEYRVVPAVNQISFAVDAGETVAFIGPNGAGKSTTIKMLTGILHPSGGTAQVLGMVPWEKRRQLAFHIGAVFGQKSQLWYHLPPLDSLELLGRIYELRPADYRVRVSSLVERFALEPLMRTPVRKLSLGERMRCELVACFLHHPRIVFLDEPTIGLDVVAKQRVRELIRDMNCTEGVTVFLTSHDIGDIEQLCRRVMMINHGELILDVETSRLRYDFLQTKVLSARLSHPVNVSLPGVEVLKQKNGGIKLQVDTSCTSVHAVLEELLGRGRVEDINISDPPLELIIRNLYQAGSADDDPGADHPKRTGA